MPNNTMIRRKRAQALKKRAELKADEMHLAELIRIERGKGATWVALAEDMGMSRQGLRMYLKRHGETLKRANDAHQEALEDAAPAHGPQD